MKKMYRYPKTGRTRYRVTVADDGAIKVKHNDSLDQYSMAIHGVPINEHEYLRVRNGQLVPVANVDLIHTHETLYHIPTRKMFGKQGTQLVIPAITVTAKSLFKSEKQWRMVKYFEKQHRLPRDRSIKLTKAIISHLHTSGVGFQTFVLLGELAPLIGAYSAAHVLGVCLGPLLSLVGAFLGLHTALTSQADKIELMAFCYGSTAWAFGEKNPPKYSPRLNYLSRNGLDSDRRMYERVWNEGAKRGFAECKRQAARMGVSEDTYKIYLRYLGNNSPATLCKLTIKTSANKITRKKHRDSFLLMPKAGVFYNR